MDFKVIVRINDYINGVVWGVPVLVLIALVGIYYTVALKGIQFFKFGFLLKIQLENCLRK